MSLSGGILVQLEDPGNTQAVCQKAGTKRKSRFLIVVLQANRTKEARETLS